ncbi:uncharacterized protein [Amphiura filiformis]|uniref:uncharacterized protein n=1 Tax=Amphiura filiformis TaxID=82378 RepID=UPI003B21F2E2
MTTLEAQFWSVFSYVGLVTLAVSVSGDRWCYHCTTVRDARPQCKLMENSTFDCFGAINETGGCRSDEYSLIQVQFQHFTDEGPYAGDKGAAATTFKPSCGDGKGSRIFSASESASHFCDSEEILFNEFQDAADGFKYVNSTEPITGIINGTVCYCQTSPCPTAKGNTHGISYAVIIVNVVFVIMARCNL